MSIMATELKATTMEQRAKALLCERDLTSPAGKLIYNERFQEAMCQGTSPGDFRERVLRDGNWNTLNPRQKAFIMAEVDLYSCPVRVGDTIEVLVDNASSAPVQKGSIHKVTAVRESYVVIEEGAWAIGNQYFRLHTSTEFPPDPNVSDVNHQIVEATARGLIASFVTHSNDDGTWGSCGCRTIMDGVDNAAIYFDGRGIAGRTWITTPEGKRWMGEVVRWMRAMVVQQWLDRQPIPIPDVSAEDEAHEAPVGPPNPDPVVITPVEQTAGALALRLDELTAQVTQMTRDMERLRTENVALRTWKMQAIEDAEKFCNTLSEIADRRELCSEFEESIESANRVTSVLQFESTREKNVEVEVTGSLTIPFSINITVPRRRGDSDSDVEERAGEYVTENYSGMDLARNYRSDDPEIEIDEAEIQ